MNVLLLTSHSIAEHDDLDMFTRMGVPTFSIGAYTDPRHPTDDKRPALPDAPWYPDLAAAVELQREMLGAEAGDPGPRIDWAKAWLPDAVLAWADTIIVHHFPQWWIGGQWDRIRDHRVIWRTCGQSSPDLEDFMARFVVDGLQVVRYSPRERIAFRNWGAFAGEDAMIRFGKDPAEWTGWHGRDVVVGNVTQNMAQRGDACGFGYWAEATRGLPVAPAGPGSEIIAGGVGALGYEEMREYLRRIRVYLYTGTRPASYTLGLIEAAMTGVPVVTMGPGAFEPMALYEAHELGSDGGTSLDNPAAARSRLRGYLDDHTRALAAGTLTRDKAIRLFGLPGVMAQWADFLGVAA